MNKSKSYEDYLERILMLKQTSQYVRAIDIANSMNFSKPSVSIALKKLKADGLITVNEKNSSIELTSEGLTIASSVLEKHHIISSLLKKIGVSDDVALEDACNIEHDLSDESFEKLKEYFYKLSQK